MVMSPHQPPWASGHRPTLDLDLLFLALRIGRAQHQAQTVDRAGESHLSVIMK